ncbi:cytochrome c family protein [Chelatococcus sp. SYSU_G07232]|uniref:Cytochrome c family protein n=1 Tax=Chelatococcus albus TaxID=3047466 RepID=A0ABT7AE56_9HYPH|nr:cytochrome c family protein [Chelatococcus sp. SYSU_G07232]MDJ1157667.1 cytochrome c family protein [Chelatococcus sp. SYSU_G07232]
MDSFELNKIAGAVLGTLLFAMGLNILAGIIFAPKKPAVPGYDLPGAEETAAAGAAGQAQAPAEPLPVLLAKADPKKGEAAAKKCLSCHDFSKGGPNKVGPNLYDVVGRAVASHAGFGYSGAMKSHGGDWGYELLDAFLQNPKKAVPGTAMAFAGVPKAEERADILAYLRTLADSPKPLPQ